MERTEKRRALPPRENRRRNPQEDGARTDAVVETCRDEPTALVLRVQVVEEGDQVARVKDAPFRVLGQERHLAGKLRARVQVEQELRVVERAGRESHDSLSFEALLSALVEMGIEHASGESGASSVSLSPRPDESANRVGALQRDQVFPCRDRARPRKIERRPRHGEDPSARRVEGGVPHRQRLLARAELEPGSRSPHDVLTFAVHARRGQGPPGAAHEAAERRGERDQPADALRARYAAAKSGGGEPPARAAGEQREGIRRALRAPLGLPGEQSECGGA